MQKTNVLSAFAGSGMPEVVQALTEEIRELYLADEVPWVVGYSGGKDSTATLQLVWMALRDLPDGNRHKPVYVISTDTLVENPVVAAWVSTSLTTMTAAAQSQGIPVIPNRLTPEVADTFWVNLIGKGYPAPRPKFRWCTERLKIKPSNAFINRVVRESGEAILVLGIRKTESAARARAMAKHERLRARDRLSPNASLPNSLVYSPVEDWTNDDIWTFLMQYPNPWGYRNKDLLTMYQGASADGECPLVVDASTPSCGDSRFGCWVCTLVEKDKSMQAMIQNDQEKEWMLPLLELRNELDVSDDRHLRDFRRMNGSVQLFHNRVIPGPYTQESRERWLRRVLEAQQLVRENGPKSVETLELITLAELQEIRRIWVIDKHEIEDILPRVYADVVGEPFPGTPLDEAICFSAEDLQALKEACGGDRVRYETVRELLDVERRHRVMSRRAGLYDALTQTLRKGVHETEDEATEFLRRREAARERISHARRDGTSLPELELDLLPLGADAPQESTT